MVDIITGIKSTTAALSAERTRLDIISQNIANANVTHGPDGKPYQRQLVVFESALRQAMHGGDTESVPRVASIQKDPRPPQLVYQPGNPDADANGMVATPNISIHEEMADLMTASRAYEANLAVVKSARQLVNQTLAIGKR